MLCLFQFPSAWHNEILACHLHVSGAETSQRNGVRPQIQVGKYDENVAIANNEKKMMQTWFKIDVGKKKQHVKTYENLNDWVRNQRRPRPRRQ